MVCAYSSKACLESTLKKPLTGLFSSYHNSGKLYHLLSITTETSFHFCKIKISIFELNHLIKKILNNIVESVLGM